MEFGSSVGRSPLFLSRVAVFTAAGVVAGLALSAVPNVELVTAICFCAGFLLGPAAGIVTGALTEIIFAGFHPMGSTLGIVLAAQMTGMALAGFWGAVASGICRSRTNGSVFSATIILFGIISTLIFDLLTNLAFPLMAGFSLSQTVAALLAGVPFALIHILSNVAVFSLIVVPLIPRLQRILKPL